MLFLVPVRELGHLASRQMGNQTFLGFLLGFAAVLLGNVLPRRTVFGLLYTVTAKAVVLACEHLCGVCICGHADARHSDQAAERSGGSQ